VDQESTRDVTEGDKLTKYTAVKRLRMPSILKAMKISPVCLSCHERSENDSGHCRHFGNENNASPMT